MSAIMLELEEIEMMLRDYEDTLRELMEIKKEIKTHSLNCKIAKTAGTVANGVGVALTIGGIIAAPFSLGVSLGLTIGALYALLVGGLTSLGAGITKRFLMNKLRDRTKKLMEETLNRHPKVKRIISDMLNKEAKGDIISVEDLVFEWIEHNPEPIYAYNIFRSVMRIVKILKLTGSSVGPLAMGAVSAGGILLSTTKILAMMVAFTADVASLVKDWRSEERLGVQVQELIDVILEDSNLPREEDFSTTYKKYN